MTQPPISRHSNQLSVVSRQRSPWQMDPGLFLKRTTSTQIRRPGPKRPHAWESERPQSGNPVWLVEAPLNSALALSKASAANTVIRMPWARDRVSMPSPTQSPPLQINVRALLCLRPPHVLQRLPPHARPLPLPWQAPLRVLSLVRTHLWVAHLHFCPQAQSQGSRFRGFPPLGPGACLCHLLPPSRGSHMLGPMLRQCSRVK